MNEIQILTEKDAISVQKENGTHVDYYIFDEFEIHQCRISPHSRQEWHMHQKIEEVLVVTHGEICVQWREGNAVREAVISQGAVLRVKNSIHTIENKSDDTSEFNVFRMVPTGENKRELIKNDKIRINE